MPEIGPAEMNEVSGSNILCFSSSGGSAVQGWGGWDRDIAIPALAWLGECKAPAAAAFAAFSWVLELRGALY